MQRRLFRISGRVQGVGFRPFVFRLAARFELSGHVRNAPEGVLLEAQGDAAALALFSRALREELPPLARITACAEEPLPVLTGEDGFRILQSEAGLAHDVLISPDVATCPDCLSDLRDPQNRRHLYPFTNCTNCGPRYTITAAMPYDRAQTSMACFELCPECAREYADPNNRRFHAQPNACPVCGPKVWLVEGKKLAPREPGAESLPQNSLRDDAALREVARRVMGGHIAAVKGLGGFHLVCNAADDAAVARLRAAKSRPHKPLAIMVKDAQSAGLFLQLGKAERALLESIERPIVLCPGGGPGYLSPLLSPDTGYVGVMLPYTPLHHILLGYCDTIARDSGVGGAALVMTSGNRGGEPIALGNREALTRLRDLADVFLLHNRDILIRTDDSVLRPIVGGGTDSSGTGAAEVMFLRRARGFVPVPLPLPVKDGQSAPCVLGLGAELKNTLCLSRGAEAFVSQHIGDMQNLETGVFQREIAAHLAGVLQVKPALLVCDAHPDFAVQSASAFYDAPLKLMQHHFAHASAVLAENAHSGPALVLALDGTGFAPADINPDHGIWGGELLFAHPAEQRLERVGSLKQIALPGGEAAIRNPWRIAHALLLTLGLLPEDPGESSADKSGVGKDAPGFWVPPWLPEEANAAALLPQMLARRLNTPFTSSAGRLFDAVSALLGVCLRTSYEGQAPIRLEQAQFLPGDALGDFSALYAPWRAGMEKPLPCPVLDNGTPPSPRFMLDTHELFRALHAALVQGAPVHMLSRAFHYSLAGSLADLALAASRAWGTQYVGLSGGVMQNMSLHVLLTHNLRARGLVPLTHRQLPPGDGCIAYGQVAWHRG